MGILTEVLSAEISISDLVNPKYWVYDALGVRDTSSGIVVNHDTSMNLAAYFACIRVIADDVAKIPLDVLSEDQFEVRNLNKSHPVCTLFRVKPNNFTTPSTYKAAMTHFALAWGNGFSRIVFNNLFEPVGLNILHPSYVTPRFTDDQEDVEYLVRIPGKDPTILSSYEVLHLRGLGANGLTGYPVAQLARESIGIGLAAQEFTGSFYKNGAWASGTLEHPDFMEDEDVEEVRTQFAEMHSGSAKAWKPILLEGGLTYKPLGMPLRDAQFLETRREQVLEICRWFRVAPHKVFFMEKSNYSNMEQMNQEYLNDSLMSWLNRWEEECYLKLFYNREDYDNIPLFRVKDLMRADSAARGTFYKDLFHIGAIKPNEVRSNEGYNPLGDEGEETYIQSGFTTLKRVQEDSENPPEPPPALLPPVPPGQNDPTDPVNDPEKDKKAMLNDLDRMDALVQAHVKMVIRKEYKAVENALSRKTEEEYNAWATQFYSSQVKYLVTSFDPFYRMWDFPAEALVGFAIRYYGESRMIMGKGAVSRGDEEHLITDLYIAIREEMRNEAKLKVLQ